MERLNLLVCLAFICVASTLATELNPRGARPVQQATRGDKCATQREWPFCTDDNWGPKCPSGCRIQGLMDKYDLDVLRKIEKIRSLVDQNKAKHRNADQVSKQTYSYLREKLTIDAGNDNTYYDLAQSLRQRITDMKIKIDRQLRILGALKDQVKDQVADMQRLEVDIDIKLRSCKGSCQTYSEHQVDQDSYVELEKQVNQLDSQSAQSVESVGTMFVMKSRPLQDAHVDSIYKSKDVAAQQKEEIFPGGVHLSIEEEGSSLTSAATISKVPGTSLSSSTSSSTSSSSDSSSSTSSSSTSSKSITELGGEIGDGLFGLGGLTTTHVSSKSVTCTKVLKRTVVHTKDGPVETTQEVMEGGPECQSITDHSNGGMSAFFPGASGIKTVHTASVKSGMPDPFADTGFDFGGFQTDNAEDDRPKASARSVKSTRVERQADYIGKGTETSDLE